jgi:hypothetical protein
MRSRIVARLSAALVVLACASSVPRAARADEPQMADAEAREKSRAAFRKGVGQLRAQDWGGARASFEAAWGLYPHPSILLNLGIARLRTEDPVRAEQDLVRFLSEDVGASPEELASAREALAEARTKLGTLRVVVSPPSARVVIDGRAVETVRRADPGTSGVLAEVRAKPGKHSVVVEADGFAPDRREIDLVARGEVTATITLARSETPKPPDESGPSTRTVVGWSLAGLAGAALITSGVTALRAKTLSDEYGDRSSARFQDATARSEGITFRTAADVALSVAVLSAATAAILLLTDLGKSSPSISRGYGTYPSHVAREAVLHW